MTKENPASTREAALFMSKLSGISTHWEKTFPTLNSLCRSTAHKPPKRKVMFPAAHIKVVTETGEIVEYYSEGSRFDQKGIIAKEFRVTMARTLDDFGIEYHGAGRYRDCEKGGWYSMTTLYKIKNHNFYFI